MQRHYFQFLIILLLCLPPAISMAQTAPVQPWPDILEDHAGTLTPQQLASPAYAARFQRSPANTPDFGYTDSTYWLHLTYTAHSAEPRYLLVDQPIGGEIALFAQAIPQDSNVGTEPVIRLQQMENRLPLFQLDLPQGKPFRLFLRANNGKAILRLPLKVLSTTEVLAKASNDQTFYALIMSGAALPAIYNLLLFFSLRDSSYISLVVFAFAGALEVPIKTNNLYHWGQWHDTSSAIYPALILVVTIAGVEFIRHITQASSLFPRTNRWLKAGQISCLALLPFLPYLPASYQLPFWISNLLMTPLLGLSIIAAWKGVPLTRSALASILIFCILELPYMIGSLGLLPMPDHVEITRNSGFLLAALLLSLVQAARTRLLHEQKERMEAINQAKDEFLTTMSHELRTPVNSVVAVTELLKQGQLPNKEQEYVSRLETAARHMLGLINDILDLSRLQLTKITLNDEVFQLSTLLDHLKQMLQASAVAKNLTLHLQRPTTPNQCLRGDPQRLSQILLNLLGNAIKFTEQGSVTLHVREIGGIGDGSIHLHFEVADTGIGITPEDQAQLFQPFTQVDSQRTRRHGGSGLGLAISRKLVETMGGKLELESAPGAGSRFFFTLVFPVAEETPPNLPLSGEEQDAATTVQERPSPLHILLVDDDEMNRFFGCELLTRLGAETSVAGSGAEAIQQLQQQHFDLVFMDVSMPEMDGYETTRQIRTDPRFTDLPVIALTAHAITGEKERCFAAGMNDYLTKPFTLAEMQTTILRWIK